MLEMACCSLFVFLSLEIACWLRILFVEDCLLLLLMLPLLSRLSLLSLLIVDVAAIVAVNH